ncbi:MAG: hypothetical protein VCA35_08430, partial [Roseibacillus sp.]
MNPKKALCALFAAVAATHPASADVKLPTIFGSHMVLQRDAPLHLWGTADAGEKIAVKFGGRTFDTTAEDDGTWMLGLPTLKADGGKAHTMTVKGKGSGGSIVA